MPECRAIGIRAICEASLIFVRGLGRYELVADMPVVDIPSGQLVAMRELEPLYSDAFLEDFR